MAFQTIILCILFASLVVGNTIDSIKDMSSVRESDFRSFLRIDAGLDASPLNNIFKAEELKDGEFRIHMMGDSTTRNQFLGLCSILNAGVLPVAQNCVPSPGCTGHGWGYKQLVVTGTFDAGKPTLASQMPKIITTALKAYNATHFDVIYFGSTALHMLQLFPAIDRGDAYWPKAINFREDVSQMIKHVASFTTCPVFHTLHYVCDEHFYGERVKAINKNYKHDNGHLQGICKKRLPRAIDVCKNYSMTSQGTTIVAQEEQQGVKLSNTSIAVVDAFSLTYKQCWASSDGIHYRKLLPLKLRLLSEHVRACQRASSNFTNFTADYHRYNSAMTVSAFKYNNVSGLNESEKSVIALPTTEVSSTLDSDAEAPPSNKNPKKKRTKKKKGKGK